MATLYARIPDPLHRRLSEEARARGLTLTAATILMLDSALNSAERKRKSEDNRGARYPIGEPPVAGAFLRPEEES